MLPNKAIYYSTLLCEIGGKLSRASAHDNIIVKVLHDPYKGQLRITLAFRTLSTRPYHDIHILPAADKTHGYTDHSPRSMSA